MIIHNISLYHFLYQIYIYIITLYKPFTLSLLTLLYKQEE